MGSKGAIFLILALGIIVPLLILSFGWKKEKINEPVTQKKNLTSSTVLFFESLTCPHCARLKPVLYDLKKQHNFTLVDIKIERNRKAFNDFLEESGLNENLVLRIDNIYLGTGIGTPTLLINGKYIMIGEFYSNLTRCVRYVYNGKDWYLCPSGKKLFLNLISNKKPEYINASVLDWMSFLREVRSTYGENCKSIRLGLMPLLYCEKDNKKIVFLDMFLYFIIKEKGEDVFSFVTKKFEEKS